jgi:hypothetical protein
MMIARAVTAAGSATEEVVLARALFAPDRIAFTVGAILIVSAVLSAWTLKFIFWMQKEKEYRRNPYRYPEQMVISSLREIGVRKAKKFFHATPERFQAHQRVREAVISKNYQPGKGADLLITAHDIAMLVYPGEAELKREHILVSLITERGVCTVKDATALLAESQSHPTPLTGGAL